MTSHRSQKFVKRNAIELRKHQVSNSNRNMHQDNHNTMLMVGEGIRKREEDLNDAMGVWVYEE